MRNFRTLALCPSCGGSGLHVDVIRRAGEPLTVEEVEMLDSTRCYECGGDGRVQPADADGQPD